VELNCITWTMIDYRVTLLRLLHYMWK